EEISFIGPTSVGVVVSVFYRTPTLTTWGTVGAVGLVWVTDWRLILDYVPYINGKFKKDD
uniref:Cytochrome b-c1 complex subunit 10 n=1 Tax=Gopherus agassizii TaxID=38772 RepID=A0A452GN05_9SAUR